MKRHGWYAVSMVLLVLLLNPVIFANKKEKGPADWGKVSPEDLRWTVFEADTNANAVILSDVGEVEFVGNYDLLFHRHIRIKILNSDGYEWGDVALRFYTGDRRERITGIQAQTYTLDGDNVSVHSVNRRDMHTEEVSRNWSLTRFAMPALQPGAIIEYKYTLISESVEFLEEWSFQSEEPTLWSEFTATIPATLEYITLVQKFQEFELHEQRMVSRIARLVRTPRGTQTRWAMADIPALRDEPYITTREDFLNKIRFQLKRYALPGYGIREFLSDWKTLVNTLHNHDNFGAELRSSRSNRAIRTLLADLIPDTVVSEREKMQLIYEYVRTNVTWNGQYRVFSSQPVRRTLETLRGNSSEIALLLTAMLQQADITAMPVVISTRGNGRVVEIYPIATQFNHVLTLVQVDGEYILLDAKDRHRPWNLLPYEALTSTGLIIEWNQVLWVDLNPNESFTSTTTALVKVDDDGTLRGELRYMPEAYSAVAARRYIQDENEEKFIEEVLLKNLPNSKVFSHECNNLEDIYTEPEIVFEFENSEHALVVNDRIIIDPLIVNKVANPFFTEHRHFPVNFGYLQYTTARISFVVPEGYEIEEMPESFGFDFGDMGAYRFLCGIEENTIQLVVQKVIYRNEIPADQYADLRQFYGEIESGQNQQIVLRKIGGDDDVGALHIE
jgi:transglutaminase-like putative cysteine protease